MLVLCLFTLFLLACFKLVISRLPTLPFTCFKKGEDNLGINWVSKANVEMVQMNYIIKFPKNGQLPNVTKHSSCNTYLTLHKTNIVSTFVVVLNVTKSYICRFYNTLQKFIFVTCIICYKKLYL